MDKYLCLCWGRNKKWKCYGREKKQHSVIIVPSTAKQFSASGKVRRVCAISCKIFQLMKARWAFLVTTGLSCQDFSFFIWKMMIGCCNNGFIFWKSIKATLLILWIDSAKSAVWNMTFDSSSFLQPISPSAVKLWRQWFSLASADVSIPTAERRHGMITSCFFPWPWL